MENKSKLLIPILLVLLFSPLGINHQIHGVVLDYSDNALTGMVVNCSNSTMSNTSTTGATGVFNYSYVSGTAIANGTYSCVASGSIGRIAYDNSSNDVVVAGVDKEQDIYLKSSYDQQYGADETVEAGIDLIVGIIAGLVTFVSIIALAIIVMFVRGQKIKIKV